MSSLERVSVAGLLVCALATGCSLFPTTSTQICVDWVYFETSQAQYDHASLVVIGKPVRVEGHSLIYGYNANVHLVEVETVLKGEPGPAPLRIASTPPTCSAGVTYPDGDPLGADQRMIIYANRQGDVWSTQTPAQGAEPFEVGRSLPFSTVDPIQK